MTNTMTANAALTRVQKAAEAIRNDETQTVGTVSPGDVIRQGDLYLVALGSEFVLAGPTIDDRQLAPGTTQGSRHTINGPATIVRSDRASVVREINRLVNGAAVESELVGPVLRTDGPCCTLAHPEHGDFVLPAGEVFAVVYQRAFADVVRRQLD